MMPDYSFVVKIENVTVNFYHYLGVIPRKNRYLQLPVNSDVLNKNINFSPVCLTSEKKFKPGLMRPGLKLNSRKILQKLQRVGLRKAPMRQEKPNMLLKKSNILLKKQRQNN